MQLDNPKYDRVESASPPILIRSELLMERLSESQMSTNVDLPAFELIELRHNRDRSDNLRRKPDNPNPPWGCAGHPEYPWCKRGPRWLFKR